MRIVGLAIQRKTTEIQSRDGMNHDGEDTMLQNEIFIPSIVLVYSHKL